MDIIFMFNLFTLIPMILGIYSTIEYFLIQKEERDREKILKKYK